MLKNFLSGGFGGALLEVKRVCGYHVVDQQFGRTGICLVAAGHPFDLIKVRLQTMKVVPGQEPPYRGAMDCARKIVAAEGFRGLYRGMAAPLTGVTPIFAVAFWGYDLGKQMIMSAKGLKSKDELTLMDFAVAGAISAVPTTAIMTPGERIKCVLQIQSAENARFKGPMDVARHLVRTEGWSSLFRGTAATLLRDGSGSMAYFAVYEWIKRTLTPPDSKQMSPVSVMLGGGFAGVCNWIVAIPADVIKSRIQTAEGAEIGKGIIQHARELMANEGGVFALYKGAGPAMLRAFPANAACFLGVEVAMQFLNKLF